jgi:hypothetical protein
VQVQPPPPLTWKAAGREIEQQQHNGGHPNDEARGGSEGAAGVGVVVVGTGGDGMEDSRGH